MTSDWMLISFKYIKGKKAFLTPPPPLLGCLHLPWALLAVVVAQFWIYSSAVPQIGLSKPSSLFEEDP